MGLCFWQHKGIHYLARKLLCFHPPPSLDMLTRVMLFCGAVVQRNCDAHLPFDIWWCHSKGHQLSVVVATSILCCILRQMYADICKYPLNLLLFHLYLFFFFPFFPQFVKWYRVQQFTKICIDVNNHYLSLFYSRMSPHPLFTPLYLVQRSKIHSPL